MLKFINNEPCHVRGKETAKCPTNETDTNRIETNEQKMDDTSFFMFWAFTFAFTATVVTSFIVIHILIMLTHIIYYFISCKRRFSALHMKRAFKTIL